MNYEPFPEPPEGPPLRQFKETFLLGLKETKESKQRTRDWENYIRGYRQGLASRGVRPTSPESGSSDQCGNPNINMPARPFADAVMPDKPWTRGSIMIPVTLRKMLQRGS